MSPNQTPVVLKVGDIAPDFTLYTQKGEKVSLTQILATGQQVLLVFYPKDMTPGCTTQLCGVRDVYADYAKLGVVVYGVNQDNADSHKRFIDTHVLPFDLLIDEGRSLAQQYGAIKSIFGNTGTKRGVFLIGLDQKIHYQVWGQQDNQKIIELVQSEEKAK